MVLGFREDARIGKDVLVSTFINHERAGTNTRFKIEEWNKLNILITSNRGQVDIGDGIIIEIVDT